MVVKSSLAPILLGCDFLHENDIVINFSRNEWTTLYSGQKVKFSNPPIPQLWGTLPPELEAVELQPLPEESWCKTDPEEPTPEATVPAPSKESGSQESMDTLSPEPYPEAWVTHHHHSRLGCNPRRTTG